MSSPTYFIPHNKNDGMIKMFLNNEFISCYNDKSRLRYLHFLGENTSRFINENDELGTFDIDLDGLINKMIEDKFKTFSSKSIKKTKERKTRELTEQERIKKNKSSVWLSEDFPNNDK